MSFSNFRKVEKYVDNEKDFDGLLMDLWKAFDYLNHELLIAKSNAYGFPLPVLKLIHDYLLSCSNWH